MSNGTMRAVEAGGFSLDSLRAVERPIPHPRRGEILVRVRAASLNYRDLAVLGGKYIPNLPLPFVPASDACGEVAEVGEEVTRFSVGDRVVPIYTHGWHDGLPMPEERSRRTLGAPCLPSCKTSWLSQRKTPSCRPGT
jgi:NADPH:quinone reductase-like Zn-dependent oxidoreductase